VNKMNNGSEPGLQQEESVRSVLTIYTTIQGLLLIFFFGAAPFLGLKISQEQSVGVVELLLPVFTGYIGMMLGFYFGTKDSK
jgi:hypothetical protein